MKTRPRRRLKLASKEHCMEACLLERDFECRSANWYRQTNECTLSDQDRHSVSQSEAGDQQIKATLNELYGPSNLTSPVRPIMPARPTPPPGLYQNYYLPTGDRLRNILINGPNETNTLTNSSMQATTNNAANSTSGGLTNSHSERLKRSMSVNSTSTTTTTTTTPSPYSSKSRRFRQLFSELQRMRAQLQQQPPSATRASSGANLKLTATTTTEPSSSNSISGGGQQDLNGWPPSQYVVVELQSLAPVDYLENNCVYEPNKLCEFRKIQNRVLKTVDSIYQDVNSLEECKQKCLNAPYRCYSFDYGDTSERVCRTSHLDQASLLSVKEPYLDVVGAITYELASCFNVSIQCRAREMVAQVSSSKMFRGKIYVKSRPNSCLNDVKESLQFELTMRYHDENCDVRATSTSQQGVFSNDIVIQHHDRIVTTQDVGLSVYCQYDLGNRSITNNVDLAIDRIDEAPIESKNHPHGQLGAGNRPQGANLASSSSLSGESGSFNSPLTITSLATTVVKSPNVTMRITNMNGQPVASAMVGDRLALLFEIKEKTSPFGIFVREIVAMDGKQLLAAAQAQAASNNNGHRTGSSASSNGDNGSYHYGGQRGNSSSSSLLPLNEKTIESMFQANKANSVQFIDSDGCPTDANIMGPLIRMDPAGHRVLAPFDAFKFPTSDMVFFRAVVTSCVSECRPVVCQSANAGPLEGLNYITSTTTTMSSTSGSATSPLPTTTTSLQLEHQQHSANDQLGGLSRHMPSTAMSQLPPVYPSSYSGSQLLPEVRATTPTPSSGNSRWTQQQQPTSSVTVNGQQQEQPARGKLGAIASSLQPPNGLQTSEQQAVVNPATSLSSELHGTTPSGSGDSLTTIPGFPGSTTVAAAAFPAEQTPPTWRQQQQPMAPSSSMETNPLNATTFNNNNNNGQTNSNKTNSFRPSAMASSQVTNPEVNNNNNNNNNANNNGEMGSNNLAQVNNLDPTLSLQQRQQIVKLFETKLKQQLLAANQATSAPNSQNNNNNNNGNFDISKSMADLYTNFITSIMLGQSSSLNTNNNNNGATGEQSNGNNNNLKLDGSYKRLHETTGGSQARSAPTTPDTSGQQRPASDLESSLSSNSVIVANSNNNNEIGRSFIIDNNNNKSSDVGGTEAEARRMVADDGEMETLSFEPATTKPINGIHPLKHHLPSVPVPVTTTTTTPRPQSILEQEAGGATMLLGSSSDASAAVTISPDDLDSNLDPSHYNNDLSQAPPSANGQAQQTFDNNNKNLATEQNPYRSQRFWRQSDSASAGSMSNGDADDDHDHHHQDKQLLLQPNSANDSSEPKISANLVANSSTKPATEAPLPLLITSPPTSVRRKPGKQQLANMQALADSYLGAFQSYGRKRKRRQVQEAEDDEEENVSYILVRQPQESAYLAPSVVGGSNNSQATKLRFTSGLIELYPASQGPPRRSRRKREAQPSYDMEELVVQSIKIMDRLQFHDDDNNNDQPTPNGKSRGQKQNLPKSQLVTSKSQFGNQTRSAASLSSNGAISDGSDASALGDLSADSSSLNTARVSGGWSSSGALSLLIVASSFIFVQIFLVVVCLIEYNQRRQAAARTNQLRRQRASVAAAAAAAAPPLSRCGSMSTLSSSNTLFLGTSTTSVASLSNSSGCPSALASPNEHLLPMYHNSGNIYQQQISPNGIYSSLDKTRTMGRKEMESQQQHQHLSCCGGGRQGKGSPLFRASKGFPSTWGLLASNNDRQEVGAGTLAAAALAAGGAGCIACRLPNNHHNHL